MKVLGIVAEYNPFHNGHLYHVQTARALTGAECIVAVMSGNFTQRGEPAIVDKWARTEMALFNGVDLVIELPCVYAMSSAEFFAFGAVRLLDSLGAVDTMCFGSEAGSLEELDQIASILSDEPADYKAALKSALSDGKSFPAARQEALSAYLKIRHGQDILSGLLENPNNILGIEYLKALRRLNSRIIPVTVKRFGNEYHSSELTGEISSATSIRRTIAQNNWSEAEKQLKSALPHHSLAILNREFSLGKGPVFSESFSLLLLSLLRSMSVDEIRTLPDMEDGLENRFKLAAETAGSYEELLKSICTKRYTSTRIQRSLFCLITGLRANSFNSFHQDSGPSYIRILGFNQTGRQLLASIKDSTTLPVITKSADFKNSDIPNVTSMLGLEAAATDQYVLGFGNPACRKSGSEFTHNVIYQTSE